ncbi:MAG TPA: hypothetical protein DCE43_15540 [Planctomycetaceae bacterium]|nr:hypothetical protein [Planctomycetaceae bacterium]
MCHSGVERNCPGVEVVMVVRTLCRIVVVLCVVATPLVAAEPIGFWSFQPLRFTVPRGGESGWPSNSIDQFILRRMELANLRPSARADDEKLLRRVCFDLLGLPPTSGQRDLFLSDRRPDAWSRLVDRLLANPHMGERWGRHWLDVVRFAESYGFEHDLDNKNAYHFRDFVIRAFNDDMPFDRFVRWQLAGDELAPADPLARMATGFLAAGVHNADIAKVRVEQERYDELDDLVNTVGTSLLGLSVGCARCHDHKFDPISQEEYYRFVAIFERTVRGEMNLSTRGTSGSGVLPVLVAGEGLKPLPRLYNPGPAFFTRTWFLRRGDVKLKDHEVRPGYLDVLLAEGAAGQDFAVPDPPAVSGKDRPTLRRSGLARWVTDTRRGAGHLLARVIVNRIWQHHFGRGLVNTPNDFGDQGQPPTHPELLDWLASELIRSGWQMKSIHRMVLGSQTYRQAVLTSERTETDDALFRGRRVRRLEAESIRDSLLVLGDRFDSRMFGPGSLDTSHPRRAIYFRVKRSQPDPLLALFDLPDTLQGTAIRSSTIVSPQALAFLNGPVVRQAAAALARRLQADRPKAESPVLVRDLFRRVLGREPDRSSVALALEFLEEQKTGYQSLARQFESGKREAGRGLVLDLTAVRLSPGDVSRWADDRAGQTGIVFRPRGKGRPRLVADATPTGRPAVRFGPGPTVLQADDNPLVEFGTGDFTVSVVFRMDPASGGGTQILGKDSYPGGGASYTGYFFHENGGHLRFSTRNLRQGKGPVNYLDSIGTIQRGRWHRATAVRSGRTVKLFLDDKLSPDRTLLEPSPTHIDNTVPLKLGLIDEHDSGAFHGDLAEVRIYRRSLSDEQVRLLHVRQGHEYLGQSPPDPLDLAWVDLCQAIFCLNEFLYIE